jgi:hypothetical protein
MTSEATEFLDIKRLAAIAAVVSIGVMGGLPGQATAAAPTATTGPALSLTTSSANVTGTFNPNGESTTFSFQFGKTTAYGFQTNPQSVGAGTQDQVVSATLTGLDSGTTYHYRLIATNASGTTVGMDLTFTTLGSPPAPPASPPPTATTGAAVSIGRASATVRGRVNPKGAKTTYYFEVGLTPAYGSQTQPRTLGAGNRTRTVSATLRGLQPGQTYHYRLVATNVNGVALGKDRAFTTSAPSPPRAIPRVTSRARPRRDHRRPFRFRVRGRLIPPSGVSSAACRGRVTIRFKRGRKTVRLRRVRVSRNCRYRSRTRVGVRPRRRPVTLRVLVRFRGNSVLRPRSARTRRVRAG